MGVTTTAISQLQDQIEQLAADPELDPADRAAQLRSLRDDLAFLLGSCDRYLGDQELQREGDAIGRVHDRLAARENADVRGVLIDRRMATPEQLDAAGLLSHDELDRRTADGTIEEAVVGVAHLFDPTKHPRGRGGKFAGTGKIRTPKGRRGQTLNGPRELARDEPGHEGRSPADMERPLFLGGVRTPAVRAQLGSARDTKEKYSVPVPASPGTNPPDGEEARAYTDERKALHRKLIEKLFADGGRGHGIAADPQPEAQRHAVFVAGGPASGKSSADEYMPKVGTAKGKGAAAGRDDLSDAEKKLAGSVEIDQDWFKKQLDEYRALAEEHDPYASDAAHREAADLAHMARLEAMRRGYNVVVQGTGNSGTGQFARKIKESADQGYKTHVFAVSAPTEVAMQRAQGRAAATSRAVPEEGLRAMHANVSRRWSEVEALAPHLESLQLFDSREDSRKGGKARRMEHLDKPGGELVVDKPGYMAEFRAKAEEHPEAPITNPTYV